ncbi:Major facilitator superfamily transporter-permease [Streptococcus sp. DD10]|nr:Major facilitator superfamily transporter-permease [Streptococcus sp. DD10]
MEKVSILALSLVLTTAFSISSALPYMLEFYKNRSTSDIELLISLPSVGIIITLLLNGFIEKFLSERQMIVIGLVTLSISGTLPFFVQNYLFIFVTRLIFGMGVGLINAKAISIISERYQGKERTQTLGFRGSAEVVGTALLTLGSGQFMRFGWTAAFLVYSAGFIVLILYLFFVPYQQTESNRTLTISQEKMTRSDWKVSLYLAFVAAVIVFANIAVNLRIPSIVAYEIKGEHGLSSLLLSSMQLIGILAGISFAKLVEFLHQRLLTVIGICFGASLIAIGLANNLLLLASATIFSGFAYSVALTTVFHTLSEKISSKILNQATSVVVLGCSTGAAITPIALNWIGSISSQTVFLFTVIGLLMIFTALSTYITFRNQLK